VRTDYAGKHLTC